MAEAHPSTRGTAAQLLALALGTARPDDTEEEHDAVPEQHDADASRDEA